MPRAVDKVLPTPGRKSLDVSTIRNAYRLSTSPPADNQPLHRREFQRTFQFGIDLRKKGIAVLRTPVLMNSVHKPHSSRGLHCPPHSWAPPQTNHNRTPPPHPRPLPGTITNKSQVWNQRELGGHSSSCLCTQAPALSAAGPQRASAGRVIGLAPKGGSRQ